MRKSLLFILLFIPFFSFSQKNELVTYIGKTANQLNYQQGDIFQLKYERSFAKSFNIQAGLRYYNELYWRCGVYSEDYLHIGNTYNSYKIDATAIFIPLNGEHFKLKIGAGLDAGLSLYSSASEGHAFSVESPSGVIVKEFWSSTIKEVPDFGVHLVLSGNYYFKNNLFCSLQILFNQVLDEEEYSPLILRNSPLSISLGVGHRF